MDRVLLEFEHVVIELGRVLGAEAPVFREAGVSA